MKTSTFALLTSTAMALSVPNYQIGKRGNIDSERELQLSETSSPTPSTHIEVGIKYSTMSENSNVVDAENTEVIFFPRHSPEAQGSDEPEPEPEREQSEVRQESADYDESEGNEDYEDYENYEDSHDSDDLDSILIPRQVSEDDGEGEDYQMPMKPQVSEDYDESPDTKRNNEIIEKLVVLETEVISMSTKLLQDKKLDRVRYFAIHSDIIKLREDFRSRPANMENRRVMEGVISKVLNEYDNLNQIISTVCNGEYDRYGYCSTFSADTFFNYARDHANTFSYLLREFKDELDIRDSKYSETYVPSLVNTYKKATASFMELRRFGLNRWLNGNKARAVEEYLIANQAFEKITMIIQKYKLV